MIVLIPFAFLAGVVTILSPCILPILPIVLSGSVAGGKKKPIGIILGFVGSFVFFTLFLTAIVKATGISAGAIRAVAVVVIFLFGLSMLTANIQHVFESAVSRLLNKTDIGKKVPEYRTKTGSELFSGILIGISTGIIWTPCVGPIIASVIALALTGTVTGFGAAVTFAYAVGAGIPLLAITYGGRSLIHKFPTLLARSGAIQRVFGLLMIVTAVAIHFNADRKLQAYIATALPEYGAGLTKIEDTPAVATELKKISKKITPKMNMRYPNLGKAPELVAGGKWFNTKPLKLEELSGKVVLVDFWTYTCINCLRTLPYIKAWNERYKDKGLVVIGVHTPEFEFEKNAKDVEAALASEKITYPVMQDNDYETWEAYDNHYWPAKYLIDGTGRIRYTHFGEGDYDETEKAIQDLLAETGDESKVLPSNPSYQIRSRTPELYLGYMRIERLSSPEHVKEDAAQIYSAPRELEPSSFAYSGEWMIGGEWAAPRKGAKLELRFDAANVFLVMRVPKEAASIRILLDGKPLAAANAGADVKDSTLKVNADRLYKIVDLPVPGDHVLTLEFLDDNVETYAFTFG